MDAVKSGKRVDKKYKVYFGGSYEERWSEDATLSVVYSDRRWVEAEQQNGRWIPVGGDEELVKQLLSSDCPQLIQDYFQAAATVYAAVHDCIGRGLGPDALGECFSCKGMPIAAPELMRLLMDDCGFSLDTAYRVTAFCCEDLTTAGLIANELYSLQPRTAHVAKIIRHERPDAIIPGIGGQTGLNLAMQLEKKGILKECNVELLGTSSASIERAEDRELFKELCESIGEPVIPSEITYSLE